MRWPFELPPGQDVVAEVEEEEIPRRHEVEQAFVLPEPEPDPQPRVEAPIVEVDPNQVREEIRREAQKKQADLAQLQALKAAALQRERREAAQRHVEQQERLRRTVEEERNLFRDELREVLKRFGIRSGPEIAALQQRYTRPLTPEVSKVVDRLRSAGRRINRHTRVQLYRRMGMSEAMVLDELAHEMARDLDPVLGPRSQDESLIRAARLLLILPLPGTPDPPLGALRAQVGRPG